MGGEKMKKKLFLIAVIFICVSIAIAWGSVHYADQVTVEWDPVATMKDGSPVIGEISYEVYVRPHGETEKILQGETSETSFTITLSDYQECDVGVRTVLTENDERFYSEFLWSIDADPPFTVRRYPAPAEIVNLRIGSD
jgi:hypothetical protein